MLTTLIPANTTNEFALDVRQGLVKKPQKELPSKYFYDATGSALFEVICQLPEYGLTRAEERLLSRHAKEIVDILEGPVVVAELGSGTGRKTRFVLEALCDRHPALVSPDRDFAKCFSRVRARVARHQLHQHRGFRERIPQWLARSRGAPRRRRTPAGALSGEHDRQL